MNLKVCGLNNYENILQVLEHTPNYIGFIFYKKSARYVDDKLAVEFIQNISSAKKVGVFVNETDTAILDIVSRYGLDFVQLHGDENSDFCKQIQKFVPVIKAFQMDDVFNFSTVNGYENCCDFFLFDTKSKQYGGSGETFNWGKLAEYKLSKPFFLSGGIDLQHIETISKLKRQFPSLIGIDVNSKFEIEPGIKDIEKIKLLKLKLQENEL